MKIIKLAKTILITCAIVVQTSLSIYAQDNGGKPLIYGVKLGLSESTLTLDNQPNTYSNFAPVIGGFAQYSVLPWVAASAEVVYTQYGGNSINPLLIYSRNSSIFNNGLAQTNLKVHCLEIPISAKVSLPDFSGSVKPFLSAGLSLAFNMKANAKNYFLENNNTNFPFYYSANDNVTSRVKAATMSFITGAGVQFNGSQFNYTIEVFYKVGMTDINVEPKTYAPNFRANSFGLKIGVGL